MLRTVAQAISRAAVDADGYPRLSGRRRRLSPTELHDFRVKQATFMGAQVAKAYRLRTEGK